MFINGTALHISFAHQLLYVHHNFLTAASNSMKPITIFLCGGLIGSAAVYLKFFSNKAKKAELSVRQIKQELHELKESIQRKRILMLKVAAASTVAIYLMIKVRSLYMHMTSSFKQIK